jgi:hypothetical protein
MITTFILTKNRTEMSGCHSTSTPMTQQFGKGSDVVVKEAVSECETVVPAVSSVNPKDNKCVELLYDVNKCFEKEYSCDDMIEKLCICSNNDANSKSAWNA